MEIFRPGQTLSEYSKARPTVAADSPSRTLPENWVEFQDLKAGPFLLLPHDGPLERTFPHYGVVLHEGQSTTVYQKGKGYEVGPGRLHIIPPGNELMVQAAGNSVRLFVLLLNPAFVSGLAQELSGHPIGSVPSLLAIQDPALYYLGLALKTALREGDGHCRLLADSITQSMAIRLVDRYHGRIAPRANRLVGSAESRIQKVIAYMGESLDQNIGISELAAIAGLSPFYFCRLFKQVTRKTPHQFILQRRIETAAELLRRERLSIAEVAQRTGFADQSHLGRNLKAFFGVTPASLQRKRVKNGA